MEAFFVSKSHLFLFASFPWNPLDQCAELLLYFQRLLQRLQKRPPCNLQSISSSRLLLLTSKFTSNFISPPPASSPPAPFHSSPSHSLQLLVWSRPYLHLKGEVVRVHLQPRSHPASCHHPGSEYQNWKLENLNLKLKKSAITAKKPTSLSLSSRVRISKHGRLGTRESSGIWWFFHWVV